MTETRHPPFFSTEKDLVWVLPLRAVELDVAVLDEFLKTLRLVVDDLIGTFCSACSLAFDTRACRAVNATSGREAACRGSGWPA